MIGPRADRPGHMTLLARRVIRLPKLLTWLA